MRITRIMPSWPSAYPLTASRAGLRTERLLGFALASMALSWGIVVRKSMLLSSRVWWKIQKNVLPAESMVSWPAYVLLKPKEGWDYVRAIMSDPEKDFSLRHAALKATRFLWDYRSDLKSHKELAEGLAPMLEMKDIADLAIEDFRKWQYWAMTDRILGLQQYPVANVNVVKRSMLRYALSAKDSQAAQKYVAAQRAQDAEMVADVEELLKLEQPKK